MAFKLLYKWPVLQLYSSSIKLRVICFTTAQQNYFHSRTGPILSLNDQKQWVFLAIKWKERGVLNPECAANATFRMFNEQICSIESLVIVPNDPTTKLPNFENALQRISLFVNFLQ
ncbi:unnamed protein product [Penicillium roqueforti FM164]|uniref:Uncharacterized protein n=1 Tax=Penicillium roqueforti (strain FM164) TaxID=1365484 RepID=W6QQM6_PENRF|nr:unnamed protein product [Penicillium roqueforti FM164]